MKKVIILVAAIFLGINLIAQEEGENKNMSDQEFRTLFGGDETTHGGYGGISVNYTTIDGKDAVLVGARGAWIINHGIAIGIAGYGFANDMTYEKTINGYTDQYSLVGGYGGLLIEPIIGAKWPVHFSVPILIGAGGATYVNQYWNSYYSDPSYEGYYQQDSDAFFVLETGIEVELNMVKFMRLAVGGYYRYTSDLQLTDTESDILDGFSVGVTMKFGKF